MSPVQLSPVFWESTQLDPSRASGARYSLRRFFSLITPAGAVRGPAAGLQFDKFELSLEH
ncbi:MAG TPA: hypothetical protein VFB27_06205 [Opitutaceae bacterium]|nr:hypothetical protein [Opitutaceae bacterium]